MTKKREIEERQDMAGIPDSQPFGGSAESDAAFDSRPIMDLHVGGVLVREMPVLTQRMIRYEQTDEGYAELQAGRTGVGVTVVDQVDKGLRERDHDLKNYDDQHYAFNPLKFLDQYKRPGFGQKLLTTKRGEVNPDYQVVKKANGDPVRYKSMVLGEIPLAESDKRRRYYRQRNQVKMNALTQQFREKTAESAVVPRMNEGSVGDM